MKRVKIACDGPIESTRVVDLETGKAIPFVTQIDWHVDVDHFPLARIEVLHSEIDVETNAEVSRFCPMCESRENAGGFLISEGPPGGSLPFRNLKENGLLWLINRVVFHPRGFALSLVINSATGQAEGWKMLGDGSEPFSFGDDEPEFDRANRFLRGLEIRKEDPGK